MTNPFMDRMLRTARGESDEPMSALLEELEARKKTFPFERIETTGVDALATWERLRDEKRGIPIVVGSEADLEAVIDHWAYDTRSPEDILEAAATLEVKACSFRDRWLGGVPLGKWPNRSPMPTGLSVAHQIEGRPLDRVFILMVPAATSVDVPAFRRWGEWNECPAAAYHVAVLRRWHERYGAELVGLSSDVLNLRVRRRPANRRDAVSLAYEHFTYCEDIVTQGTGAIRPLAAALSNDDWWYFWWD